MSEIDIETLRSNPALFQIRANRVAVVASFGETSKVTKSLGALVAAFTAQNYETLIVRASDDSIPLEWPDPLPSGATVVRRPNEAYDFGSWAAVINLLPQVRRCEHVLLVNDSLVGPFAPIDDLLDDFEATDADAWGAVVNPQVFAHVQSFFYGFRNATLDDRVMRDFWQDIHAQPEKMDYVWKYELGLNRALFSEGYVVESKFGDRSVGYGNVNPTLDRWRELMIRGFPFVKRALLTDVENPQRASEAVAFTNARFGIDISEWM